MSRPWILLMGVALLSLGCAGSQIDDPDPCCLTYEDVKALFAMSACIEPKDVPKCLEESANQPPEPGIDPARAEKYLFIKDKTVGIAKEAKKNGRKEVVVDFRMVEKADKKIKLVFNGEEYAQKSIKDFRAKLKDGDVMILPMKYSKKAKSCELIGIFVIRPEKKDG